MATGPFNRFTDKPGYSRNAIWYRQGKPWRDPLPYAMNEKRYVRYFSADPNSDGIPPNGSVIPVSSPDKYDTQANNAAYQKLVGKLGDSASLAVSLAEMNQSVSMIASRASQLTGLVRALKRLDFYGASDILGMRRPPKGVSRKKEFSNNFLEYHFGWAPLIGDIGTAMEVLTREPPYRRITGSGTANVRVRSKPSARETVINDRTIRKTISVEVRVINPNLFLLSQMGFVNPVTVAWETIPFSFVVDWFVNVGDCLRVFDNFLGLAKQKAFTSTQLYEKQFYSYVESNGSVWHLEDTEVYSFNRSLGYTGPVLAIKPFKGFSVVRGATAVSLLVQSLK